MDQFARRGAATIAELVKEHDFRALQIWEPGEYGPFRRYFRKLRGYQTSRYWPAAPPGETRDGVRCENLMDLTFPSESLDLIVTSDVFEHVRRPYVGFAEVHRVLRTGGVHVFSVPVAFPMRDTTTARVDTSGDEDVLILDATFHGPHLVYNDFGRDMLDRLRDLGLDTSAVRFESPNETASRLISFVSVKRP